MPNNTYLVTGALGCIGAWTVYHLLKEKKNVVSFDIGDSGHRLDYLLSKEEQSQITFVKGDLSDYTQVQNAIAEHGITHVIHLAALQVPFCKANPVRGAQVNVTGTVNIFDAARQNSIQHVTFASSIAVYGPPDLYPTGLIAHDAPFAPSTLYGVYKQANEGTAKIYWQDHQVSSTTLRPYTIYGVGRDQGLTSDPTKAMLAVSDGKDFAIQFGGKMPLQWASDVAQQFILASEQPLNGAFGFNLGGEVVDMDRVISGIQQTVPTAKVTHTDNQLPFPEGFDDSELRKHFSVYETPLEDGITKTIEQFKQLLADGKISA